MYAARSLRSVVSVLRMPAPERRRSIEAAAELTRASLALRFLPPRRTTALLGAVQGAPADPHVDAHALREAELVGRAVARAAAVLPWSATCLRQAVAAQRMLRRRRIPSRLHLGVTGLAEAQAHAWVTVQDRAVVGGHGLERFVPLAAFR